MDCTHPDATVSAATTPPCPLKRAAGTATCGAAPLRLAVLPDCDCGTSRAATSADCSGRPVGRACPSLGARLPPRTRVCPPNRAAGRNSGCTAWTWAVGPSSVIKPAFRSSPGRDGEAVTLELGSAAARWLGNLGAAALGVGPRARVVDPTLLGATAGRVARGADKAAASRGVGAARPLRPACADGRAGCEGRCAVCAAGRTGRGGIGKMAGLVSRLGNCSGARKRDICSGRLLAGCEPSGSSMTSISICCTGTVRRYNQGAISNTNTQCRASEMSSGAHSRPSRDRSARVICPVGRCHKR